MRYYVHARDEARRDRYRERLAAHGFEVVDRYDEDALIVTFGGDGTILYAARQYPAPTILPVRTGRSVGERAEIDEDDLIDGIERFDAGRPGEDYTIERHRTVTAARDGEELDGGFAALNEISLHHRSPVMAVEFDVAIEDGQYAASFEDVVGDGLLVATPFGSTGYFRSITGGSFDDGLGVAFNNVHTPRSTPDYLVVSAEAHIEIELQPSSRTSTAVLTRDNDETMYELEPGVPIEIGTGETVVEIVSLDGRT